MHETLWSNFGRVQSTTTLIIYSTLATTWLGQIIWFCLTSSPIIKEICLPLLTTQLDLQKVVLFYKQISLTPGLHVKQNQMSWPNYLTDQQTSFELGNQYKLFCQLRYLSNLLLIHLGIFLVYYTILCFSSKSSLLLNQRECCEQSE